MMNKLFLRFYLLIVIAWLIAALWFSRWVRDFDGHIILNSQKQQAVQELLK